MIRTWITDVSVLESEKKYNDCYRILPPERKEKADRRQTPEGKWQSVGAGVLLERMRKRYDPEGKAVYNLSHSGMYALCSLEDDLEQKVRVGCDVETIKNYREKVAKRFFTEEEFRAVEACENIEEKKEMFYRFWVLKESFMKATRLGMALSPREFEIALCKDGARLLGRPEEFPEAFYYREYEAEGIQAKIAVCASRDDFEPELHVEVL